MHGYTFSLANAACQHQYRPKLTLRGAKTHTLAQARTGTLKKSDSQLRRMQKIVLHVHVMKERRASRSKREKLGWKRGTVQSGNTEGSKQRSRADPWLLFEGWGLSAGIRTNTEACHMWRGLRSTPTFVEVNKHSTDMGRKSAEPSRWVFPTVDKRCKEIYIFQSLRFCLVIEITSLAR